MISIIVQLRGYAWLFMLIVWLPKVSVAKFSTTTSQIIGSLLTLRSIHHKEYNPFARVISYMEEQQVICLSSLVLLTLMSKVEFYTFITYMATYLGESTLLAHQVMVWIYSMCTVSGENLAKTIQLFMPNLTSNVSYNIRKAQ